MGIPFFIVFVLSILFLSISVSGWQDFVSVMWGGGPPTLIFNADFFAMFRCGFGFLLFLVSLYLMGFFLYLEERESGRIMKNVKSFVKLREFLERRQRG